MNSGWSVGSKLLVTMHLPACFFYGKIKVRADGRSYPFNGDGHLSVDRIDGDIEDAGDLLVFQSVLPYKLKDHLTTGGQGLDRQLDLLVDLGTDEELFGAARRTLIANVDMVERFSNALPGFLGEIVEGGVLDGGIQIDAEVLDPRYGLPLLPDPHEHILHELFGRFTAFYKGVGKLVEAFKEM